MAAYGSQPPSLAAILQTLAASSTNRHRTFTPQIHQPSLSPYVPPVNSQEAQDDDLEEGEYEPDEYNPGGYNPLDSIQLSTDHGTPVHQELPLHTHSIPPPLSLPQSRSTSAPSKAPLVDPSSITTWPSALRHVTKLVSQNEAILIRIRKLIKVQNQHEKQWWDGRNALLQKQKDRIEGRKKLDEVLKAVGGKVDASVGNMTAEDEAAELLQYDKKVHRACSDMHKATMEELKGLGIPFFGVSKSCLTEAPSVTDGKEDGNSIGKLDEKQLRALQKRMLALLEDLCQE